MKIVNPPIPQAENKFIEVFCYADYEYKIIFGAIFIIKKFSLKIVQIIKDFNWNLKIVNPPMPQAEN